MSAADTRVRDSAAGDAGREVTRGRRWKLIGLGALVVVLIVAVSGLWRLDHRDRQADAARQAALQTAREQVGTALSGPAGQGGAPSAGGRPVSTEVVASAVVRSEQDEVVVLLFVNQTTQGSPSEPVRLSAHRVQLTMTRVDDRWRVSRLERV